MPKQLNDIPVSVISGAMNAEPEAIAHVLSHFKDYIRSLSTRNLTDDYGNTYSYVDEDMQTRLETKLIFSIINHFKIRTDT